MQSFSPMLAMTDTIWGCAAFYLAVIALFFLIHWLPERAFKKRTEATRARALVKVHELNESGIGAEVCVFCHGGGEVKEVVWKRRARVRYVACVHCFGLGYRNAITELPPDDPSQQIETL